MIKKKILCTFADHPIVFAIDTKSLLDQILFCHACPRIDRNQTFDLCLACFASLANKDLTVQNR